MTIKAPAPRYVGPAARHGGKGNKPIKRIVIHCTVSSCCDSAEQIARYFRQTTRAASAHYVVDANTTIQSLYDSYIGYHAPPNGNSLGVEMCCTLSDEGKGHWGKPDHQKMLQRAAELVAHLCLAYDVPMKKIGGRKLRKGGQGVCGHNHVRDAWGQTTHWDPGPHFPWRKFMKMVRQAAKGFEDGAPVAKKKTGKLTRGAAVDTLIKLASEGKSRAKHPARIRKFDRILKVLRSFNQWEKK